MKYLNALPIWLPVFWLVTLSTSFAQQAAKTQAPVYLLTDVKPQFPGGNEGIQTYFSKKINTKNALKREIVTVSLIVTANGQVKDAAIGKGISPEIDSSVIKEARKMVKWQPGKIKGQAVDTRVSFPVIFEPANAASDETKTTLGNTADGKKGKDGKQPAEPESQSQPVYTYVGQMPEFPGGHQALYEFIKKHQVYPPADKAAGKTGRVVVEFVVTTSGKLTDLKSLLSPSETATAEAFRVIKLMPRWQPGKQNGTIVPVKYRLVFTFPPSVE